MESRSIPYDLVVVFIVTITVGGILLAPQSAESPARAPLALTFVLFLPGYAVIAMLFPRGRDREDVAQVSSNQRRIDFVERVVLSFGTSVAIVIIVGFTVGAVREINAELVFMPLGAVTVIGVLVAALRRLQFSPEDRFTVGPYVGSVSRNLFGAPTAKRKLLNGLLVFSILFAIISLSYGYGLLANQQDDGLTEFYLLPDDTEGELEPSDYTTSIGEERETEFTAVVDNQEGESVTYTMIVLLQETEGELNESIIREEELHREQVRLQHNETRRVSHRVQPELSGDRLRLAYLLYHEEPSDPSIQDAYREVHLWVDVAESDGD